MGEAAHRGLGQRILTTEAGDVPLMELRSLAIGAGAGEAAADGVSGDV